MQSLSDTIEQAKHTTEEIAKWKFDRDNQERVIKLLQSIDYHLADINWKLLMRDV